VLCAQEELVLVAGDPLLRAPSQPLVPLLQKATPGQAEKFLLLFLSATIAGEDGAKTKVMDMRAGKKRAGIGGVGGKAAAERATEREERAARLVEDLLAALGGNAAVVEPLRVHHVGLFAAPEFMAAPGEKEPVSAVPGANGKGKEPPPWGNNEGAAVLGTLAERRPEDVVGVAVAVIYCATRRTMAAYEEHPTNKARWEAWRKQSTDWDLFAARNAKDWEAVPGSTPDTWLTRESAVSRTGCGPGWAVEQVDRLLASGERGRRRVVVTVTASYAGSNSVWLGDSTSKNVGGCAFGSPTGATVPATAGEIAAMLRSIAKLCRDQLDPPEVVLAMCQAQKVRTFLSESPPPEGDRINVAYFDGAHPSDLLPFTSALLVACSGDTGKFAELYNTSLPALLAMDEAAGWFEEATIGSYVHVAH